MPPPTLVPVVHLFTDGGCSGNPGPGGWAFILRHPASGKEMEHSGGEPLTTNNRMELMAVIQGLEALKHRSHVELFTDSEYVRQGIDAVDGQVESQRLAAQKSATAARPAKSKT